MNKLESLIQEIENNEQIKRYKELSSNIEANALLKAKVDKLKQMQKQMVKSFALGKSNEDLKKGYDMINDEIINNPSINEYLDLKDEINELLKNIKDILEKEINL